MTKGAEIEHDIQQKYGEEDKKQVRMSDCIPDNFRGTRSKYFSSRFFYSFCYENKPVCGTLHGLNPSCMFPIRRGLGRREALAV